MSDRNFCGARIFRRICAGSLLVSAIAIWLAGPVHAQNSAEAFYKGRIITILIGFPPGGSYDIYARLTSAHLGKHIPGHPTFVVQNKPNGGIGLLRSFYESAP